MSNFLRSCWTGFAGSALALASAGAFAANVEYFATQGPKADLNLAAPPVLSSAVSAALDAFNSKVTQLGRNEFETGSSDFSYGTGGNAALSTGSPSLIDGNVADLSLGRYNMTAGLPPIPGVGADFGHWLEDSATFSYKFTGGSLNAFAFFATDLGDFGGTFTLDLLNNGAVIYSRALGNATGGALNGDLHFFGVTTGQSFDEVRFNINQAVNATKLDVIGFDSIVVGTAANGGAIPEPTSLALTGLALLGLGASVRRKLRA